MKILLNKFLWLALECGFECYIDKYIDTKDIYVELKVFNFSVKKTFKKENVKNELCEYVYKLYDDAYNPSLDGKAYELAEFRRCIQKLKRYVYLIKKRMSTEQLQALVSSFRDSAYDFSVNKNGYITLNYINQDFEHIEKSISFMQLIDLSLQLRMKDVI